MPTYRVIYGLLLSTFLLLVSCNNTSSTHFTRGSLVSHEIIKTINKSSINNRLSAFGSSTEANYGVTQYKLIYQTEDAFGNIVEASGLVIIPNSIEKTTNSALISYQHGTFFHNKYSPSLNPNNDSAPTLLSSLGYIAIVQDYIGYGNTEALTHPYIIADELAKSGIDMIRATKLFLKQQAIPFSNSLYIAGYSEGGYATMAIHKAIEEYYSDELSVTMSFPASGPYDLMTTTQAVMESEHLISPAYVGYILTAYEKTYPKLQGLTGRALQAPYKDLVKTLFDGEKTGNDINAVLPHTTKDLLTDSFRSEMLSTDGEIALKASIRSNSVYNWSPKSPIRLFHGKQDITVPYFNTAIAAEKMKNNGTADILVVDCAAEPSTHSRCFVPYIAYLIERLSSTVN